MPAVCLVGERYRILYVGVPGSGSWGVVPLCVFLVVLDVSPVQEVEAEVLFSDELSGFCYVSVVSSADFVGSGVGLEPGVEGVGFWVLVEVVEGLGDEVLDVQELFSDGHGAKVPGFNLVCL